VTDAAFAAICAHEHIVDPPSGKRLRICLDCLSRIIECDHCDAKLVAGPDVWVENIERYSRYWEGAW
jgi:hypothetical protein